MNASGEGEYSAGDETTKAINSMLLSSETRILCPGGFDILHPGHVDFLHQTKNAGINIKVIVGLYNDSEMMRSSGKSLFTFAERKKIITANKYVDEVVEAPYPSFSRNSMLYNIIEDWKCDQIAVGSKADYIQDHDLYKEGKLKQVKSDCMISSGTIIHRILEAEDRDDNNNTLSGRNLSDLKNKRNISIDDKKINGVKSSELFKYREGMMPNNFQPSSNVVFIAGAFDILHPGHIDLIKAAAAKGDYLIIGLHSDETIKEYTTRTVFPIMSWEERAKCLMSCRLVAEVILDSPLVIPNNLLEEFSVSVVAATSVELDYSKNSEVTKETIYEAPIEADIFYEIPAELITDLSTEKLLDRVHTNYFDYVDRLEKSSKADFETKGLQNRTYSDNSLDPYKATG